MSPRWPGQVVLCCRIWVMVSCARNLEGSGVSGPLLGSTTWCLGSTFLLGSRGGGDREGIFRCLGPESSDVPQPGHQGSSQCRPRDLDTLGFPGREWAPKATCPCRRGAGLGCAGSGRPAALQSPGPSGADPTRSHALRQTSVTPGTSMVSRLFCVKEPRAGTPFLPQAGATLLIHLKRR